MSSLSHVFQNVVKNLKGKPNKPYLNVQHISSVTMEIKQNQVEVNKYFRFNLMQNTTYTKNYKSN